jgi:hypothetical protein
MTEAIRFPVNTTRGILQTVAAIAKKLANHAPDAGQRPPMRFSIAEYTLKTLLAACRQLEV